jgi:hypothetical protein
MLWFMSLRKSQPRGPAKKKSCCEAERYHWSECGRATSVAIVGALDRPHRSFLSFGGSVKRSLSTLLVVVAVIAAAIAVCAGPIWWTLASSRRFLLKRADHRAVATACLDLLTKPEYQPLMGDYPSGSDPRLPAAIREVKAFWLSVHTNSILIMKTGGHYHMGFIFRPSASDSNRYELVFREEREFEHDIPLYSVRKE